MRRRDFLRTGLAAPAIFTLSRQAAIAKGTTLRLHHFQPPMAVVTRTVLSPWIETVAAATDGDLTIQKFDAMALGGRPPELMGQAQDGVVDIAMTLLGYTPGRFPRSEVFELPFLMTGVEATCRAFHQMAEQDLAASEFANVKVLAAFVHGPGAIHSNRPVTRLEDMAGLKLRAPTRLVNELVGELGATPVGMPLPAVPEALSKGVADGTVLSWETTTAIRLSELVSHHTEFSGAAALYTAAIVIVMNKAKFEALPEALRQALDAQSGAALSALAGRELAAADAPARQIALDLGNRITTLDSAEVARWQAAAQPVTSGWIDEMATRDIDGQALIDRARTLIAEHAT
ncbi:TRAP transporter substrate-binding protein [Pseudooceanicola sp. C21-150M6]|uniref:TRAP transporter substrate-binding protein n=1 Tax=Pseudooceanicola sp. C21-150M6 TaxID=3434355 RepID=UPI003D7F316E